MSETTKVARKESTLKRFAKAFYAKVKAAKARFIALFGENETPVRADEGAVRKTARIVLAIPKWIGHGVVTAGRAAVWVIGTVAGLITVALGAVLLAAYAALMIVMLAAYKVVQLLSLVLRTPYLMVRGDDCLKTDWVGYGNLWKPKYFYYTRISQVFAAQAKEEAESKERHPAGSKPALTVVSDRTKHEPTPKQVKHRPAKMPVLVGADA